MIVDDEPELRDAMAHSFKKKGFNVLQASNGNEAFAIIQKKKIDLVLSDVRMPGGSGQDLLRQIKSINPKTPVLIFVTGYAELGLEEAYGMGAEAVFSKPFRFNDLFSAVTRILESNTNPGKTEAEQIAVDLNVNIKLPEVESALETRVLSLGMDGMFISPMSVPSHCDTQVEFNIKTDRIGASQVLGLGIVKWVRSEARSELPVGVGIEITHLDVNSRAIFLELINELRTRAATSTK